MPTPIGHSLMGYIIYSERKYANWDLTWKDSLLFIIVANLPDIDFVPGFFTGNPNQFHHGMTHSIGFMILVGSLCGIIYYLKKHQHFLRYFSIFSIVYFSHLVLDFFGKDTRFPFGEQLFWPISSIYVMSPVGIFRDVSKASSSDIFIQSLLNWHNLHTIIVEAAILLPLLWFIKNIYSRQKVDNSLLNRREKVLTE